MSVCASCKQPLVLQDVDEDDANEVLPDDLLLPCGDHFHWQCLLDEATQVVASVQCPACGTYLAANQPAAGSSSSSSTAIPGSVQIRTRYVSEGGLQENYDIFPVLAEEAYLAAHPEARPARAFLTMCAEGDVMGIVSLVTGGDDEDEDEMEDDEEEEEGANVPKMSPDAILRYQDPLGGMQSGLHAAVEHDQEEVAFLLLYLASRLPLDGFPPEVLESAAQIGLERPASVAEGEDIRQLQNARGETAETVALRRGGQWAGLAQTGIFTRV